MLTPLTKDMVVAGNAIFTIHNGGGKHFTFRVVKPKQDHQPGGDAYFAQLLTGPDNTSDYTYVGLVNPVDLQVRLTRASKLVDSSVPVRVLRWALAHVQHHKEFPSGYFATHAGRCCRCGRLLTDPVSVQTGFGPECRHILGKGDTK